MVKLKERKSTMTKIVSCQYDDLFISGKVENIGEEVRVSAIVKFRGTFLGGKVIYKDVRATAPAARGLISCLPLSPGFSILRKAPKNPIESFN